MNAEGGGEESMNKGKKLRGRHEWRSEVMRNGLS